MIIKICKPDQYEIIPTATLQDKRLALDELGLLVRLISRPNGWEIYPAALRKETGWGRDKLRKTLRNYQRYGYLRRFRGHERAANVNKKPGTWKWTSELYVESQGVDFYEQAQVEAPPSPENQGMVVHARVIRTTDRPATAGPYDGQHGDIVNTDHNQYRPKTTTTPKKPSPQDQNPPPGNEVPEYLALVGVYGAQGDRRPDDPEGIRDAARLRIMQEQGGRLSDRDTEQLSRWRKYRQRHQETRRTDAGEEQALVITDKARREGLKAIKKMRERLGC
jgi:hypothetical protein